MVIGHSYQPESLFNNPTFYSQAFPWLFPYGLGSIDNLNKIKLLSAKAHKRHLLMYHDKRFQLDRLFPLVAFNQEQIKTSTTAGFILTKQSSFNSICNRISTLDMSVLDSIIERSKNGEYVKPELLQRKHAFNY